MTAAEILELVTAALQFPNELLALVRALQTTPQAAHAQLIAQIQQQAAQFAATGRASSD